MLCKACASHDVIQGVPRVSKRAKTESSLSEYFSFARARHFRSSQFDGQIQARNFMGIRTSSEVQRWMQRWTWGRARTGRVLRTSQHARSFPSRSTFPIKLRGFDILSAHVYQRWNSRPDEYYHKFERSVSYSGAQAI